MRISDWISDVCSSDLKVPRWCRRLVRLPEQPQRPAILPPVAALAYRPCKPHTKDRQQEEGSIEPQMIIPREPTDHRAAPARALFIPPQHAEKNEQRKRQHQDGRQPHALMGAFPAPWPGK